MDEHDPKFDPELYYNEPQEAWLDFLKGIARAALLAVIVGTAVSFLAGCEDYERQVREAEFNAKVMRACLPEDGQRTVVSRDDTFFTFTRIDIGPGRYSRSFPHVEVRVKTLEEQM